jgi:EAL domain-containing protein (putative c-di-GMP-specific phosphodiesterase class I)
MGADPSSVRSVVEERDVRVVYQPIVDLQTYKVFSYEALTRCPREAFRNPAFLFDDAARHLVVGELGRIVREKAIDGCPTHPLFLNVHPHELSSNWLVRPDDALYTHEYPVYLEVTESVPMSHFELCKRVISELRSNGVRLAIDDLGAGFSNLGYIADLEPDIVKLDRALVSEIHQHPRRLRLLENLVHLCVDMGAKVVAEGIEEEAELVAMREAGVHYGQGYLLAKPASPPPVLRAALPDEDAEHRSAGLPAAPGPDDA